MSTASQQPQSTDAITLIQQEIQRSESERTPISRQMLADVVHEQTKMGHADASALVDQYCDEHAPAVPYYLQEEFAIPYLKVIAIINVLLGIGAYYWGINVYQQNKQHPWPWLCVGTIFVGLGVLSWVKSLERFAARKAKKQA